MTAHPMTIDVEAGKALLAKAKGPTLEVDYMPQLEWLRWLTDNAPALLDASERLGKAVSHLNAVLDTSGARGEYHALKYVDAVEGAETFLTEIAGETE